jgi:hypothetical protein
MSCVVVSDEDLDESDIDELHKFADYVGIGYSSEDANALRSKIRFYGMPVA